MKLVLCFLVQAADFMPLKILIYLRSRQLHISIKVHESSAYTSIWSVKTMKKTAHKKWHTKYLTGKQT